MDFSDKLAEVEEKLKKFENENPKLVEMLNTMGYTIEEYNSLIASVYEKYIVTSNSTVGTT